MMHGFGEANQDAGIRGIADASGWIQGRCHRCAGRSPGRRGGRRRARRRGLTSGWTHDHRRGCEHRFPDAAGLSMLPVTAGETRPIRRYFQLSVQAAHPTDGAPGWTITAKGIGKWLRNDMDRHGPPRTYMRFDSFVRCMLQAQ